MILVPIRSQEMIIKNVDYNWGKMAIVIPQALFRCPHHRMCVSIMVNEPMHENAFSDFIRIIVVAAPFHPIRNKIANEQIFVLTRKVKMREKVHM